MARVQDRWAQQQWASHIPALTHRLQLQQGSLTGQQVDALWHLCQQEAGLWGIEHRACSLFSPKACPQLPAPPLPACFAASSLHGHMWMHGSNGTACQSMHLEIIC